MAWSYDGDENAQPPSGAAPDWLQRFAQAFSKPVERLADAEPHLMAGDQPDPNAAPPANAPASVGQYNLPGVGPTYLDPDFTDRVGQFIGNAKKRGVDVQFTSGYRTQAKQDSLQNDPNATTPAKNSLHPAGRAVDIKLPLSPDNQVDQAALNALVSDAAAAGLNWGGHFKNPTPDPGHFYYDPGGDRRQLIGSFTQGINKLRTQIPDR